MSKGASVDGLGPVLDLVDVTGVVFVHWKLTAPWGFAIPAEGRTFFHIVVKGSPQLVVEGSEGARTLSAGDFVVLPHGSNHVIRDGPESLAPPLADVLRDHAVPGSKTICWGGDGARTEMICGEFRFADRVTDPLLMALPSLLHIPAVRGAMAPWLERTLEWITLELRSESPGANTVVQRLADILFIQAVRTYVEITPPQALGWLRGLRDPRIARALSAIHREPNRPWSVAALADRANMSRSAFANRFRETTGLSPMRYLARWRLSHAAAILRKTNAPLIEVAQAVGYDSEVGFSKAFKRHTGFAPGTYRGRNGS